MSETEIQKCVHCGHENPFSKDWQSCKGCGRPDRPVFGCQHCGVKDFFDYNGKDFTCKHCRKTVWHGGPNVVSIK